VANKPFGYLLTADCYKCDPHTLNDVNICYNFLEEAVRTCGVSMQAPPLVIRTPSDFPEKAGLSAVVFLVESSIVCHTLCVKQFCSVVFYTCSTIDRAAKKRLLKLCHRFFKPEKIGSRLIKIGTDYYD